jgi:metallo-beta-lactamase class B
MAKWIQTRGKADKADKAGRAGLAAWCLFTIAVAQDAPRPQPVPLPLRLTPEALGHIEAARTAAGEQHSAVFSLICPRTAATPSTQELEKVIPNALPSRDAGRPWYTSPVKVFDNLYFVGQTAFSAWALVTSEGIIVIDAIFDYSVEAEVADGLQQMGLDPKSIRYVIISHGHADHVGGAKFLQEKFGARIVMGEADWKFVESGTQSWKPRRDVVATDGMQIRLGDTAVRLVHTPGHTPGTFSSVLPLRDNGVAHTAVLWGGTLFNFADSPGMPRDQLLADYTASAEKMRRVARESRADVLLSNHTRYDGSTVKLPRLAQRQPGQSHPYVIGADGVDRFLLMAGECAAGARAGEAAARR